MEFCCERATNVQGIAVAAVLFQQASSKNAVTTKVARLETIKTRSHKGTKKEKVLKFLVFLVSLCLCGD
jgi:hypothetical protein